MKLSIELQLRFQSYLKICAHKRNGRLHIPFEARPVHQGRALRGTKRVQSRGAPGILLVRVPEDDPREGVDGGSGISGMVPAIDDMRRTGCQETMEKTSNRRMVPSRIRGADSGISCRQGYGFVRDMRQRTGAGDTTTVVKNFYFLKKNKNRPNKHDFEEYYPKK